MQKLEDVTQTSVNANMSSTFMSLEARSLFPLRKISDLQELMDLECFQKSEPDLSLISIILGAIEHSLVHLDYSADHSAAKKLKKSLNGNGTTNNNVIAASAANHVGSLENKLLPTPKPAKPLGSSKRKSRGRGRPSGHHNKIPVGFKDVKLENDVETKNEIEPEKSGIITDDKDRNNTEVGDFPPLELEEVEALYYKFKDILISLVDIEEYDRSNGTPVDLVKRVSDVVWSYLSRSYKADTPHIQYLYTYLLGQKLDSFGVAVAVVAGCQVLGLNDVHLVLSEDHSWVAFNDKTAEVTWHGKGLEDKRGKPVGLGDDEDSWLYLKGKAVHCTRHMEAASLVAAINFNISTALNSAELIEIQQKLLWKFYDTEHLKKYPMGLSCLAELEEINPTPNRIECPILFREAVLSNRTYYSDMHIYPYTSFAGYLFRTQDYKSALKHWADAARIVQKYRRSKNDEEIYREFLEISTDYLTNVMKSSSTGFSANSIMRDPCCFANLLRFFDGICWWEERSKSPIVHITWAKSWVNAIGKFDYTIRRIVKISTESSLSEEKENSTKVSAHSGTGLNNEDVEKGKLLSHRNTRRNSITRTKISDFSLDSGIDEDESLPAVALRSEKLQQLKDLFKRENYNPQAMILMFTAQSTITSPVETETDNRNGTAATISRSSRRERTSMSMIATSTITTVLAHELKKPGPCVAPKKRGRASGRLSQGMEPFKTENGDTVDEVAPPNKRAKIDISDQSDVISMS